MANTSIYDYIHKNIFDARDEAGAISERPVVKRRVAWKAVYLAKQEMREKAMLSLCGICDNDKKYKECEDYPCMEMKEFTNLIDNKQ